ncbi:MAG TPA: HIT domain-containing protein [Pirellulales bacterium]|jgi:ATP adenylyltransferase
MNFDQLWAPWRMTYIAGEKSSAALAAETSQNFAWLPKADPTCFLCKAVAETANDEAGQHEIDRRNLVVCRTPSAIVLLNRYPYNNGHLLVAPRRHLPDLQSLADAEHLELMHECTRMCSLLQRLMNCEGFNLGLNLGRIAGAGLPGHLHWHIVPRWNGDTNFMPVLAGVNVIPQSLDTLVELLSKETR